MCFTTNPTFKRVQVGARVTECDMPTRHSREVKPAVRSTSQVQESRLGWKNKLERGWQIDGFSNQDTEWDHRGNKGDRGKEAGMLHEEGSQGRGE